MKRVVVAMSGGVDSSVAAALLKKQGFDVVGVFMKFLSKDNKCCSSDSERMARLVAKRLDIPFYVLNFEKEFKKKVIDYFIAEHRKGRTPNPCVVCNKEIKFGLLIKKALSLKADYIATGHYAINDDGLFMAKDKNKDQSYFLWQLDKNILKRVLFPIGNYTKDEVRKLARKFKLATAEAKESQEICFVNGLNTFLQRHLKNKPGNFIDKKGNILGRHQGLWFYTIGQRKGINLSQGPYYVISKNLKNNTITISKDKNDLLKNSLSLKNINWLSKKLPIRVKIRYRSDFAPATITGKVLKFNKSQRAVTPGQSAVFYKGKELIGGGIIDF